MLTSFLEQIPSAFSRRFLLGSFLPLALFAAASLLVGQTCIAPIQGIWYADIPALTQAFAGATSALVIAALALVLSGFRRPGREALERAWLRDRGREKSEEDDLQARTKTVEDARDARRPFVLLWKNDVPTLAEARELGTTSQPETCGYPADERNETRSAIASAVAEKSSEKLAAALKTLRETLRANNADHSSEDGDRLDKDHAALVAAIEAEKERRTDKLTEATRELEKHFPGKQRYPTLYARVSGRLKAYAEERYGADYEVLWPRLEAVLRKDSPEIVAALEEASTQLEFHVAMCWSTAVFTATWLVLLALFGLNAALFLCVAVLGPLLCTAWYRLGARSYEAFAEQISTAVDLGRLKVFDALCLQRPQSPDEERVFWQQLGSVLAFGGMHDIPYADRKADPSPAEHRVELNIKQGPQPGAG